MEELEPCSEQGVLVSLVRSTALAARLPLGRGAVSEMVERVESGPWLSDRPTSRPRRRRFGRSSGKIICL